ncbi:MAG: xanthine dehydrogenase family protein molybdopterin-binding subunit [Burkholderiaceae bacterium]|nr:xanthine dehydrogenase family protein molybdopterin-binding subunit [Burkholderiaceae bacterium]
MGGAGAGLIVGVQVSDASAQASGAAAILRAEPSAAGPVFNGFVRVAPDNTVTVSIKHLEMGQGPYTGLATLVAEEMDADWSQIRAESAPADVDLYKNFAFGMQGTGGSTAIANSYEQMRQAGAAARSMLVTAAAQAWSVPASEIAVQSGTLLHRASNRRATFGEMADRAARVTPPADVKLKDPKQFKLIGKSVTRLDSAAKSNGTAVFTLDVDRPGALTVVVAHPPRFGATAASVDDSAARKVPGVVEVKTIPQGVAVYANGFWAAKQGRDALRITWDESKSEMRGTAELLAEYRTRAMKPGAVAATRGEPERSLGGAKVFDAEYVFPFLAHAPMEPLDCVMELTGGTCRAWYGAQLQTVDHQTIAKVLGLAPDKVAIQTMLAGGSFGRRAQPAGDLAAEAAAALKALGRDGAIKLAWTREDDIKGGRYRPLVLHRIKAALDAKGDIVAWDQTIVAQSFIKGSPFEQLLKDGIDPTIVEGAQDLPYAIPNFRTSMHLTEVGIPTLWWRSVGHTHTGYATETMIDELLVAGGKDPVQGRLALLKDHKREAGVLRAVAQLAKWNGSKSGSGRARGVALHKSFDTYVAQIAEVSVGTDGLPKVEHVWCAVDCGVAVNPDNIRSQMEGGIGYGLGAILFDEITLDKGRVVQSNFNDYRMLRINEMPKVDVIIMPSSEKPTGVGEPGVPPIGPAVANAWRALTGNSVRHLPFARSPIGRSA